MIRVKNMGEYDELLTSVSGAALTLSNDIANCIVPAAGYLKAIVAGIAIPGNASGAVDFFVDIKRIPIVTSFGGTAGTAASVFPNGATSPIVWSHTGGIEGASTVPVLPTSYNGQVVGEGVSMAPVQLNKGDVLRIDVTQILGTPTTQPKDLSVYLVFSRGQSWAPEATLLGQFCEFDF